MPRPTLAAALTCFFAVAPALADDAPAAATLKPPASFHGWEGLRVLAMEDYNPDFIVASLPDPKGKAGDAKRTTLIALNPAKRRLDLFRWVPPAARKPQTAPDGDQPNALPAAPDFERVSIAFDTPPLSVVATDFSSAGKNSLFVLLSAPNRIEKWDQDTQGKWKSTASWDLLPGEWGRHSQALLRYQNKLLISMQNGIQVVDPLRSDTAATWLQAAQNTSRAAWQVTDLDGDGIPDLLEYTRQNDQALRLYQGTQAQAGQAGLLAPRVIREKQMSGIAILEGANQLFALESVGEGPVQQLRLQPGPTSPVGKLTPLALTEAARNLSAGLMIDGKPTLAVMDPTQPKVSLFTLSDQGWQAPHDFPVLPGVEGVIAPQTKPGTLLLKVKDADGLFASHWEGSRITYPAPMAGQDKGKVVGLGTVGSTAWWVLRHNDKLVLNVWEQGDKPTETVFLGSFDKVDRALFAGANHLLVADQYAPAPRLLSASASGKPAGETTAAHLTLALMDEFMLLPAAKGAPRLARLTAGVVQFLGEDLKPTDQVMLPDNLAISAFAPDGNGSGGYALCAAANRIFRMDADKSGLPQVRDSWRLSAGAKGLASDAALGLLLTTPTGLARLSPGADLILQNSATLNTDAGLAFGTRDSAIHRLLSADLDGDGQEELITCDDAHHTLSAYGKDLKPWISWQVFTDQKYPYTGNARGGENLSREPRLATGCDLDGDGVQDLVLACHDRLIVYLGKDPLNPPAVSAKAQ